MKLARSDVNQSAVSGTATGKKRTRRINSRSEEAKITLAVVIVWSLQLNYAIEDDLTRVAIPRRSRN